MQPQILGKRSAPGETQALPQTANQVGAANLHSVEKPASVVLQPCQASITSFVKDKHGKPLILKKGQAKGKHPKSLWYDETLHPKSIDQIDGADNIFQIIMPWVQEQLDEQNLMDNKLAKLTGKVEKKAGQVQQKLQFGKKSADSSNIAAKSAPISKKEAAIVLQTQALQKRYLSHVLKTTCVEEFRFEFQDPVNIDPTNHQKTLRTLRGVEAILINPRWAQHRFNYQTKRIEPVYDQNQAFKGITIEDVKKVRIPDFVMKDGILFVWAEKELIYEIIKHFETQGFAYVENLCHVFLNQDERDSVLRYNNTDATPSIARKPYDFLKRSHRTLLLLRRVRYNTTKDWETPLKKLEKSLSGVPPSDNKDRLELRHQRTGDVVFDWLDESKPFATPQYYTYKLIEILLPKAMNKLPEGKEQITQAQFEQARKFKMIELWAQDSEERKGWLKVYSLK